MTVHSDRLDDVTPINAAGRVPILIIEADGSNFHVHGLALAPNGVTALQARNQITDAFAEIRRKNPEEWNYGDLFKRLEKSDYKIKRVAAWVEDVDGYPESEDQS